MNEIPKNPYDLKKNENTNLTNEDLAWKDSNNLQKKDLSSILFIQFSLLLICFLVHLLLSSFLTGLVFQIDKLPEEIRNYSQFELQQLQAKLEKELIETVQKNPKIIAETFINQATSKSPSILLLINIFWILSYILPAWIVFKYLIKDKFNLFYDEFNTSSVKLGLITAILLFFSFSLFSVILYYLQIKIPIDNFQKELIRNLRANPYLLAWAIYTIAIITGIIEEIFFRGFLLHQFMTHDKAKEGLLITSIIFGAMHYSNEGSIIAPIILSFVGFAFGFVYLRTKNIWASISAHIIYNSLILIMAYFLGDKIYK